MVSRESESHFYFMVCYLLTEAAIARTGGDAASLQDIETERTGEERKREKKSCHVDRKRETENRHTQTEFSVDI